jgi:NAD(P)-dependent dehydrogenase (short-subunit alcohol dehydrogenase family)
MDLQLKGRVALVTGGSQGIGEHVVRMLAAEGCKVAFTYRQGRERADKIVADLGADVICLPLDLQDLATVDAVADAVLARWGSIDILVNNAVKWADRMPGQAPRFEDLDRKDWLADIHANVDAAYLFAQRAVPSMRKSGWGRIVNLSSGVALDGVPGASPYATAKAGVIGLSNVLARELGPAGILCNVVVPGLTLTDRIASHITPEMKAQRGKAYPVGRLLTADEVAPTIVFLVSGLNTAVTGETIRASGGRPM